MKPIPTTKTYLVRAALNEVQKHCTARTITEHDVYAAVFNIEARLEELCIPKKEWKGLVFVVNPCAKSFPRSYTRRYTPESTFFRIERRSKDWALISISRERCTAVTMYCSTFGQMNQLISQYTRF